MLQYPLDNGQNKDSNPFLIFTPIKATFRSDTNYASFVESGPLSTEDTISQYDAQFAIDSYKASKINDSKSAVKLDDSSLKQIALYMPRGIQFSDQINYNNIQNPLLVTAMESVREVMNSGQYSMPNVADTTAYLARSSVGGQFLSGLRRRILQDTQQIVNPREFALFDAPQMRNFTLAFKFMPESEKESNAIAEIIKTFRQAAYPTFANDTRSIYKFPKAFVIEYSQPVNQEHYIKFPEVVLTNVSTQYNANSMSYHQTTKGFSPVEIDMTLTFQELLPQSAEDIVNGY